MEIQINDLGILLDNKLSFRDHMHAKVNRACNMIGFLKHTIWDLSISSFLVLYKFVVDRTYIIVIQYGHLIRKEM